MIFVSTVGSLCRSVSASYQKREGYSDVLMVRLMRIEMVKKAITKAVIGRGGT